jgi:secreted Zn-dependent insulinase-like peptidase
VVVQSSSQTPKYLKSCIKEWIKIFQKELKEMTPEAVEMEARAVAMQLVEEDTKLLQEQVGTCLRELGNAPGLGRHYVCMTAFCYYTFCINAGLTDF